MANPTHASRVCPGRAHVYHPSALPGTAEPHTLRKGLCGEPAAPQRGQPPPHRVPWPRTGLGQLRTLLGGNLCLWEQHLL